MSVKEFLGQQAVNVAVGGHYTLSNWFNSQGKPRTFACRTSRVSPFRMMVAVPVIGRVGDRISSYFGDFGKLEGHISDTAAGSFLLELAMTTSMREKLATKLTWLDKKQKDPAVREARTHSRIIPANSHSTLTFADGSTRSCFIIDMSASGAAVSADVQPQVGMPLAVGACVGRVVRTSAPWLRGQIRRTAEPQRARAARPAARTILRAAAPPSRPRAAPADPPPDRIIRADAE